MADRYLLESGAPDGYLLEDGSGVLLLEDQPPFTYEEGFSDTGPVPHPARFRLNPLLVPNLLLTTLAVVATTDQPRNPLFANQRKAWPQITAPQVIPNLLLTTLASAPPPVEIDPFIYEILPTPQPKRNVNNFPIPNLLITTLATVETPAPFNPILTSGRMEYRNRQNNLTPPNLLLTTLAATTYTFNPSGSILFSGTAGVLRERIVLASGSVVFGGTVLPFTRERTYLPSGNITFSGSAPFVTQTEYTFNPSGSITFDGTIGNLLRERVIPISGSIVFSGTVVTQRVRVIPTTGEIVFSGGITRFGREKVIAPAGQITFSGSAPFIFIPAGGVINGIINRISLKISRAIGLS